MSQLASNLGLQDILKLANPQRQHYNTLEEFVNAMNEREKNSNGGIAGAYSHYVIFKYKRGCKELQGYKIERGAVVLNTQYQTEYYDDSGVNISGKIKQIGDSFYYVPTIPELWFNYWPIIVAILIAIVLIIWKLRKRKK